MKQRYGKLSALILTVLILLPSVYASDLELGPQDVYCFRQEELAPEQATGVLITAVPEDTLGSVMLGSRTIRPGDVLTAENLDSLSFIPAGAGEATISCLSISETGLGENTEMTLRIRSDKNEAPAVEDSEFETYKNIPGEVRLKATDPEGDSLTVTIVKEPKRGTLTVSDTGIVTYTPEENKVGKDSFTYTVTDTAGNVSPEATVRITIKKPSEKTTYADMEGDPGLLAATWLREMGLFSGETVSGQVLFGPEKSVTRGEFIAMCVELSSAETELEAMNTGFADEENIPTWLAPYVCQAVKCGYISGVPTEDGLKLLSQEPICRGEAAVIAANLLELNQGDTQSVMGQYDSVPVWAASAVSATLDAGIFDGTDSTAVLSRRDSALLLYNVWQEANENKDSLLAWAMK